MEYSPILAAATALFEITVAVWALRGPGERPLIRTTSAILFLLAAYQITEVAICRNVGAAGFLPRLAFLVVTWLPPLGWMLIAQLHRPRPRGLHSAARAMLTVGGAIVLWIVLDRSFASASVCSAVYARYTHAMPRFLIYSIFYWAGLLGMMVFSGYGVRTATDPHRRRLLTQVFAGTLAFVLPSLVTSWFVPTVRGALPSVMCHFALLLAVCLARMVVLERRHSGEEQAPATVVGETG